MTAFVHMMGLKEWCVVAVFGFLLLWKVSGGPKFWIDSFFEGEDDDGK